MHGRPSTSELFAVTNHTLRASARSVVIAAVPAARDEWSAPRAPVVLARSRPGRPYQAPSSGNFPRESRHMPGRHLGHRGPNTANNARSARAFAQAVELAPVIAMLQASGVTTLNGIAAELNARGIPNTPGRPAMARGAGQPRAETIGGRAVASRVGIPRRHRPQLQVCVWSWGR
jgi:hypothetical protein